MTGAGVGVGRVWWRIGWKVGGDGICSILCTLRLCLGRSVSTAVYKRTGIVSKGDVFLSLTSKRGVPTDFRVLLDFLTSGLAAIVGLRECAFPLLEFLAKLQRLG